MSSPIYSTRAAYWRNHVNTIVEEPMTSAIEIMKDLRELECRWNEIMGMYRDGLLYVEEDHLHRFLEIIGGGPSEDESEDEC